MLYMPALSLVIGLKRYYTIKHPPGSLSSAIRRLGLLSFLAGFGFARDPLDVRAVALPNKLPQRSSPRHATFLSSRLTERILAATVDASQQQHGVLGHIDLAPLLVHLVRHVSIVE